MKSDQSATSADLTQYVRVIRRNWLAIVATIGICVGLAVIYTKLQTPKYQAVAQVRIPQQSSGQSVSRDQNITDVQTEVQVMQSDEVAVGAGRALKSSQPPRDLLANLTVTTPTEARVLAVSYSAESAQQARAGAQAFADAYIASKKSQAGAAKTLQMATLQAPIDRLNGEQAAAQRAADAAIPNSQQYRDASASVNRIASQLSTLQAQLAAAQAVSVDSGQVLSPAVLPKGPAGPKLPINMAIGLVGGLLLGLILAFTRDRFDEQVREVNDLEQVLDVPILASIPIFPGRTRRTRGRQAELVTLHAPEGPHADAFRRLRSSIQLALRSIGAHVVVVSSANAADGKSTVSSNLAISLAQAGARTCLVSGDVRRPKLEKLFQIYDQHGLTDVLNGSATLDDVLTEVGSLAFLPSGQVRTNPTDLLQSESMAEVVTKLRGQFEYVIIDTPPVLAVADVLGLVPMADAVLLVVSASETTGAEIQETQAQIAQAGGKIIGAVMNRSVTSTHRYDAYYRAANKD